jgi:acetyl esterase/lipase
VIYGRKDGTALTMDVFRPKSGSNGAAVIVVVSGGFFSSHDAINPVFARPFLDRGYAVFTVVHGSQPRYTIPEIVEDVKRAVRYIRSHAADYAIDPNRIGICGASAGGHLSLMLGTAGDAGDPQAKDPVDRQSCRVQAVACFFPPTDFLNFGQPGKELIRAEDHGKPFRPAFLYKALDPETNLWVVITDPEKLRAMAKALSPVTHVSADDAPTLIYHGDADKLVPLQQSELIVAKFKETGVPTKLVVKKGAGHGWLTIPQDLVAFADWFDQHLKSSSAQTADGKPERICASVARYNVGNVRTVIMTVRSAKDSANRREIYLDSEEDFRNEKNFAVVISHDHLPQFKAAGIDDPATYFKGRIIEVTGQIIRESDQVRIRIDEPKKIEIHKPANKTEPAAKP